mmetsp:Transcript_8946/g.19149  ORF Transcript_8946/g.19149 Transcript_8946/m.19149 type:complete len:1107 (+) Transcript_8946:365-3685(+)
MQGCGLDMLSSRIAVFDKRVHISTEFQRQLDRLMTVVQDTSPHFVRCIKPNPKNMPETYDRQSVTEQLRYGGVLQAVQVSRAGYPVRCRHDECWMDYRVLASKSFVQAHANMPAAERARDLLSHVCEKLGLPKSGHSLQVGKTLIFFKQPVYDTLEAHRLKLRGRKATRIQAAVRMFMAYKRYKETRQCVLKIQALSRGWRGRKEARRRREIRAATRIAALARGHRARESYRRMRRALLVIQSVRRGILARREVAALRINRAASRIQRSWRRRHQERLWHGLRTAVVHAQQRWRQRQAVQQLRKMRDEKYHVGGLVAKLQAAKDANIDMEAQVRKLEAESFNAKQDNERLRKEVEALKKEAADSRSRAATVVELQKQVQELTKAREDDRLKHEGQIAEMKEQALGDLQAAQAVAESAVAHAPPVASPRHLASPREAPAITLSVVESGTKLIVPHPSSKQAALLQAKMELIGGDLNKTKAHYNQLLQNAAMGYARSVVAKPRPGPVTARHIDICLLGHAGAGNPDLLFEMVKESDPAQAECRGLRADRQLDHLRLKVNDHEAKILHCASSNPLYHTVNWCSRSKWVVVSYNVCDEDSLNTAVNPLLERAVQSGAKVLLFGNTMFWDELSGPDVSETVMAAHNAAAVLGVVAAEGHSLLPVVRMIVKDIEKDQSEPSYRFIGTAAGKDPRKPPRGPGGRDKGAGPLLRPSMGPGPGGGAKPVIVFEAEIGDAVTQACFGQHLLREEYVLLAVCTRKGEVVVFRCYRSQQEMSALTADERDLMLNWNSSRRRATTSGVSIGSDDAEGGPGTFEEHCRYKGHRKGIACIAFNAMEDMMVTGSIDKTVRIWSVDTGATWKIIEVAYPVFGAAFLPLNPQVVVSANGNCVLHLVDVRAQQVSKRKVDLGIRSLQFDDTGCFMFVGTIEGWIHVFEHVEQDGAAALRFKFKLQFGKGAVTCITFVPARPAEERPPCLLVCAQKPDSNVAILDCVYGPPSGMLTSLQVRHRVPVQITTTPVQCCFSPSGGGHLISGSEQKSAVVCCISKKSSLQVFALKGHTKTVVAVAVNQADTMLASADIGGKLVIWRRRQEGSARMSVVPEVNLESLSPER